MCLVVWYKLKYNPETTKPNENSALYSGKVYVTIEARSTVTLTSDYTQASSKRPREESVIVQGPIIICHGKIHIRFWMVGKLGVYDGEKEK